MPIKRSPRAATKALPRIPFMGDTIAVCEWLA